MSTELVSDEAVHDSLRNHLAAALEEADDDTATYHLREAYQKVLVLEDRSDRQRDRFR